MSSFPRKSEGLPLLDNIQISEQLLKDERFVKQAFRLKSCGKEYNTFMCSCKFIRGRKLCNYGICPVCGKIKSLKSYKKFIKLVKSKRIAKSIYDKGLRLITLTIKNQENLIEGINVIYASFRRLRNRKYWKQKVKGGIAIIEIKTGKDKLWNHHIHLLLESDYLDMKSHKIKGGDSKLVQEWKHCTRGSKILDVKRVRTHSGALNYILKYITKGISELSFKEKAEFFKITFRRRLLFTFGKKSAGFYGIKLEKKKRPCQDCGRFYQYVIPNSEEDEVAKAYFNSKPPPRDIIYWVELIKKRYVK